ncbi:LPS-assembly protein LptD [Thermodesulfobacteriota bacterium]
MVQNTFQKIQHSYAYNRLKRRHVGGESVFFEFCLSITIIFMVPIILSAIPVYGSEIRNRIAEDDPDKPWHIAADELNYDDKTGQYIATGNVSVIKNDIKLTAAYARFDKRTMSVYASGHVTLTAGADILVGDRMEMDLKSETGTLHDGSIFIKENHFIIKGNKIQKVGKQTYAAEKASVSTCDGDRPAWKITGRDLKVTIDGYGVVKHATLWIKNVPVIYSPYLVFPVKNKRQSGLLSPEFGYSDRKGAQYFQPVYWAINRSMDATIYENHMTRRGNQIGLEHRYSYGAASQGAMMFDMLKDRKTDNGSFESSRNWGYVDDQVLRPNSDRYWLRGKHDLSLPLGFSGKLDLDIVSDQDYLKEFKKGYTGYTKTESYFYKTFGRTIDDYDDPVRVNRFNIRKNWTDFNLNSEVRWYDDVVARRWKNTDTTLQKLPFVDFFAARQQIFSTPIYFDLETRYDHFYRKDGIGGHRTDIHPRVYLPVRLKHYATFEPSFGVRETIWRVEANENASVQTDENYHREMVDLKADFFSEISKIYALRAGNESRVKHLIRPQLAYEYVPEKIQQKYPSFDAVDRVAEKNFISYSITNILISKSKNVVKTNDHSPKGVVSDPELVPSEHYVYNPFCRFKLSQYYNINEARENDRSKLANPNRREPFSPVYGELQLSPKRFITIQADAEWSLYEREFNSKNASFTLTDQRGDKAFVEYRYKNDTSESIYTHLLLQFSDRISTYVDYERSFFDNKRIKFGLGLTYNSQCWSVDIQYADELDDRSYMFKVNFFGLGGIGSQL